MAKQDLSVLGKENAFELIGKQYGAHGGWHTVYVVDVEGFFIRSSSWT